MSDMRTADGAPTENTTKKKKFIGRARAEALRRKAVEQQSGPNIEDGAVATRNTLPRGGRVANQIPTEILEDEALNEAIKIVRYSCIQR